MVTVRQFLSFRVICSRGRVGNDNENPSRLFRAVHLIVSIQNFCWAQMHCNRADRSFGSISIKVCLQNKNIDNISDLKKRNWNSSGYNTFDSRQFTNGRSKSVLFVKYIDFPICPTFYIWKDFPSHRKSNKNAQIYSKKLCILLILNIVIFYF